MSIEDGDQNDTTGIESEDDELPSEMKTEKIREFFDNSPTSTLVEVIVHKSFMFVDADHMKQAQKAGSFFIGIPDDHFDKPLPGITPKRPSEKYRVKFMQEKNWIAICSSVLGDRLHSTAISHTERSLSITALLLKSTIECAHTTSGYDETTKIEAGHATNLLVDVSHLLQRQELLQLKEYLDNFYCFMFDNIDEFEHNGFDSFSVMLLPWLSKKHPSLQFNMVTYFERVFDSILLYDHEIGDVGNDDNNIAPAAFWHLLDSIKPLRSCITPQACELIDGYIDAAIDNKALLATKYEPLLLIAETTKRKLSRSSMAWIRIRARVRVIAYFSLMRNESAERLYKPNGEGARAAKRSFESIA